MWCVEGGRGDWYTFTALHGELLVLCLIEENVSEQQTSHQHLQHVCERDTQLGEAGLRV